ncbi:hypothetical protein A3Q56_04118 [Intoshia linei]|uniref:MAM domain-containing protein n=1 Tax=Intoshia linei TaxID=1819745 RepID=A0A177B1J5_9BILA|nr:hypothetical protein A3Q56_04118 [Intoshia linei]
MSPLNHFWFNGCHFENMCNITLHKTADLEQEESTFNNNNWKLSNNIPKFNFYASTYPVDMYNPNLPIRSFIYLNGTNEDYTFLTPTLKVSDYTGPLCVRFKYLAMSSTYVKLFQLIYDDSNKKFLKKKLLWYSPSQEHQVQYDLFNLPFKKIQVMAHFNDIYNIKFGFSGRGNLNKLVLIDSFHVYMDSCDAFDNILPPINDHTKEFEEMAKWDIIGENNIENNKISDDVISVLNEEKSKNLMNDFESEIEIIHKTYKDLLDTKNINSNTKSKDSSDANKNYNKDNINDATKRDFNIVNFNSKNKNNNKHVDIKSEDTKRVPIIKENKYHDPKKIKTENINDMKESWDNRNNNAKFNYENSRNEIKIPPKSTQFKNHWNSYMKNSPNRKYNAKNWKSTLNVKKPISVTNNHEKDNKFKTKRPLNLSKNNFRWNHRYYKKNNEDEYGNKNNNYKKHNTFDNTRENKNKKYNSNSYYDNNNNRYKDKNRFDNVDNLRDHSRDYNGHTERNGYYNNINNMYKDSNGLDRFDKTNHEQHGYYRDNARNKNYNDHENRYPDSNSLENSYNKHANVNKNYNNYNKYNDENIKFDHDYDYKNYNENVNTNGDYENDYYNEYYNNIYDTNRHKRHNNLINKSKYKLKEKSKNNANLQDNNYSHYFIVYNDADATILKIINGLLNKKQKKEFCDMINNTE